jgi:ketosteroid isomerase-like protein
MAARLAVSPADDHALDVARSAFLGLQRGAATGDWSGFVDLLHDDVRIMIPVPAGEDNPPEGLLVGKDIARMIFGDHHAEKVNGARLECKRIAANGSLVVLESRVEGVLDHEEVANHFVFIFEVAGDRIASMYEYATWTAKGPKSGWGDPAFAREAFPDTVIPFGG